MVLLNLRELTATEVAIYNHCMLERSNCDKLYVHIGIYVYMCINAYTEYMKPSTRVMLVCTCRAHRGDGNVFAILVGCRACSQSSDSLWPALKSKRCCYATSNMVQRSKTGFANNSKARLNAASCMRIAAVSQGLLKIVLCWDANGRQLSLCRLISNFIFDV